MQRHCALSALNTYVACGYLKDDAVTTTTDLGGNESLEILRPCLDDSCVAWLIATPNVSGIDNSAQQGPHS
jgi:hypothetical protein